MDDVKSRGERLFESLQSCRQSDAPNDWTALSAHDQEIYETAATVFLSRTTYEERTYLPSIFTAELCFRFGWTAGYGSALKGVEGETMPTAWDKSPAKHLNHDEAPDMKDQNHAH